MTIDNLRHVLAPTVLAHGRPQGVGLIRIANNKPSALILETRRSARSCLTERGALKTHSVARSVPESIFQRGHFYAEIETHSGATGAISGSAS